MSPLPSVLDVDERCMLQALGVAKAVMSGRSIFVVLSVLPAFALLRCWQGVEGARDMTYICFLAHRETLPCPDVCLMLRLAAERRACVLHPATGARSHGVNLIDVGYEAAVKSLVRFLGLGGALPSDYDALHSETYFSAPAPYSLSDGDAYATTKAIEPDVREGDAFYPLGGQRSPERDQRAYLASLEQLRRACSDVAFMQLTVHDAEGEATVTLCKQTIMRVLTPSSCIRRVSLEVSYMAQKKAAQEHHHAMMVV